MSAETFQVFLMIFNTGLGICSGVIIFYLISLRHDFKKIAEDTSKLREEMHALETSLPDKYVMREDYIRTMAAFQNKQEKTYDLVNEIKGAR